MKSGYSDAHTGRGWGVAALIVGLAIAVNSLVFHIHNTTSSRKPIDPYYHTHASQQ